MLLKTLAKRAEIKPSGFTLHFFLSFRSPGDESRFAPSRRQRLFFCCLISWHDDHRKAPPHPGGGANVEKTIKEPIEGAHATLLSSRGRVSSTSTGEGKKTQPHPLFFPLVLFLFPPPSKQNTKNAGTLLHHQAHPDQVLYRPRLRAQHESSRALLRQRLAQDPRRRRAR